MMYNLQPLPLKGAFVLMLPYSLDERGEFVKTFHVHTLQDSGIEFQLKESFYSISNKNVIRGMHFQMPPYQLSKFVFCPVGEIQDVIVDLRAASPTYGQHFAIRLSAENHLALFIPEGFAHGFKALSDTAITYYLVSEVYHRQHDTGIHINSIGYDWEVDHPNISQRDAGFVALKDFKSPF